MATGFFETASPLAQPLFAVLSLERDPLTVSSVLNWPVLRYYLLTVGSVTSLCLVLWFLFRGWKQVNKLSPGTKSAFIILALLALPMVCLDLFSLAQFTRPLWPGYDPENTPPAALASAIRREWVNNLMAVSAVASILAVALPFLVNLPRLSFRRIYAIAKLSFKEAIRKRVLYAFTGLLLILLFGSWFIPSKSSDQIRTYVTVVFWAMTVILLMVSALLAAFGIPADIKSQSLFLIVTKPVERVEILLGRLLGYMSLLTLILIVLTGAGLLYILRGVSPEAAEESLKARSPLYGVLHYENTGSEREGDNVGREWNYRGYISGAASGANNAQPKAIWDFNSLPSALATRPKVTAEFTFDIYRTTKGYENQGVGIGMLFTTRNYDPEKLRLEREAREREGKPALTVDELAEKFGYFQPAASITFYDYSTGSVEVPGKLFANAQTGPEDKPPLVVTVTCKEVTQYVGMARYDFYFREDDTARGADTLRFSWNFAKASMGLWLRILLVTTLALVLSTYLSGVVSLLVALFVFLLGQFQDFLLALVLGRVSGGGPLENLSRLITNEVAGKQLENTALNNVIMNTDRVLREFLGGLLNFLPEVQSLSFTEYVSNGFNIGGSDLAANAIRTVAYLLPWLLLGYHALREREVAGPT